MEEYDSILCSLAEIVRLASVPISCKTKSVLQEDIQPGSEGYTMVVFGDLNCWGVGLLGGGQA